MKKSFKIITILILASAFFAVGNYAFAKFRFNPFTRKLDWTIQGEVATTSDLTVVGDLTVYGQSIAEYFTATSTTATSTFAGNVSIEGFLNSDDNLMLQSNPSNDGLIIMGDVTTGIVFDEDSSAASIGGGSNQHTINGSVENTLWEFHQDGSTGAGGTAYHRHSNNADLSSDIIFLKSRGDHDSPLIVQEDNQIGHIRSAAYDGTDYAELADIVFYVDGEPGNDDMPGRIEFFTSPDGSQTPLSRMVIKESGNVGIGTDTPSSKVDIQTTSGYNKLLGYGSESLGYWDDTANGILFEMSRGRGTKASPLQVFTNSNLFKYDVYAQITNDEVGQVAGFGASMDGATNKGKIFFNAGTAGSAGTRMDVTGDDVHITNDDFPLSFGADNDYGIYYNNTTDNLEFIDGNTVGSNVRMVIDNSGNVGIGTSTPSEKLQVVGNIVSGEDTPIGSGTITDNTIKQGTYSIPSYDTDRGGATIFNGQTVINENLFRFGGGQASLDAMTDIEFYTGEINELTGRKVLQIVGRAGQTHRIMANTQNYDVDYRFFGVSGKNVFNYDYVLDDLILMDVMYIDGATDRVGIGTDTPYSILNVVGDTTDRGTISIENEDTDIQANDILGRLVFRSNESSVSAPIPTNDIVAKIEAVAPTQHTSGLWDTDLRFSTVNASNVLTERMTIDSPDGFVGFGTNTPLANVHISGQTSTQMYFTEVGNAATYSFGTVGGHLIFKDVDTGRIYFKMGNDMEINRQKHDMDVKYSGDTTADILVLDAGTEEFYWTGGNFGIGTDTPGQKLHVYADNQATFKVESGDISQTSFSLANAYDGGTVWQERLTGAGDLQFRDIGNSNEVLTMQYATGFVGIGTSTPDSELTVFGDLHINNLEAGGVQYMNMGTTTGANGYGSRNYYGVMQVKYENGDWQSYSEYEYFSASSTVIVSDGVTGTVASTTYADRNEYQLEELGAMNPGFDVLFDFAHSNNPKSIHMNVHYSGGGAHNVEVQIYNFQTETFDDLRPQIKDIEDVDDHEQYEWNIENAGLTPSDYLGSYGTMVRVYHNSVGNASHFIQFDNIWLEE